MTYIDIPELGINLIKESVEDKKQLFNNLRNLGYCEGLLSENSKTEKTDSWFEFKCFKIFLEGNRVTYSSDGRYVRPGCPELSLNEFYKNFYPSGLSENKDNKRKFEVKHFVYEIRMFVEYPL